MPSSRRTRTAYGTDEATVTGGMHAMPAPRGVPTAPYVVVLQGVMVRLGEKSWRLTLSMTGAFVNGLVDVTLALMTGP